MRATETASQCVRTLVAAASIAILAAASAAIGTPAAAQSVPPASTPVPPQFQQSYDAYLAMKAAAKGGVTKTYATLPDWSGLWTRGPGGLKFDAAQPGNPDEGKVTASLTPEFDAKYRKKLADVAKGIEWDQLSFCLPAGYPRMLTEPFLREWIVTPNQTWMINEQQSEVRRLHTDGRGHVPDDEAFALWEGDSIGFWDGDTLVVHTIRSKPGQYQRSQPDYTDQVSTVERMRKVSADVIEDEVVVWDPPALTKPWKVKFTYVRVKSPGSRIDLWSCEENNNVVKTDGESTTFILPGEKGYRDAKSLLEAPKAP